MMAPLRRRGRSSAAAEAATSGGAAEAAPPPGIRPLRPSARDSSHASGSNAGDAAAVDDPYFAGRSRGSTYREAALRERRERRAASGSQSASRSAHTGSSGALSGGGSSGRSRSRSRGGGSGSHGASSSGGGGTGSRGSSGGRQGTSARLGTIRSSLRAAGQAPVDVDAVTEDLQSRMERRMQREREGGGALPQPRGQREDRAVRLAEPIEVGWVGGGGAGAGGERRARSPRKEAKRKSKLQKIGELQEDVRRLRRDNRELRKEVSAGQRRCQDLVDDHRLHASVLEERLRAAGIKEEVSGLSKLSSGVRRGVLRRHGSAGESSAASSSGEAMSEAAYKYKIALSVSNQKLERVEEQLGNSSARFEELEDLRADDAERIEFLRDEVDRLTQRLAEAKTVHVGGGGDNDDDVRSMRTALTREANDAEALEDLRGRNALLKEEWERSEERARGLAEKLEAREREVDETRSQLKSSIDRKIETEMNLEMMREQWAKLAGKEAGDVDGSVASEARDGAMIAISALQEELATMREEREKEVERYEERLQEVREEALEEGKSSLSRNAMQESERRDDLRKEADHALEEVERLRNELDLALRDVDIEKETAKTIMEESEAETARLGAERDRSQADLDEVLSKLEKSEERYRVDMNEAETIFRDTGRELDYIKSEAGRLVEELEKTKGELHQAERNIVQIEEAGMKTGFAGAVSVQGEIVKADLARAKEELERLRIQHSKASASADSEIRTVKAEAERQVNQTREELAKSVTDLERTRAALERAKELLTDMTELHNQGTEARQGFKKMEAELGDIKKQLLVKDVEIERLKSNAGTNKDDVESMIDRCERLEETNSALEDEMEELTSRHLEELDTAKDQVSQARKELERKAKNVEVMGSQIESLQEELQAAKSRLESMENELNDLKSKPATFADDAMSASAASGGQGTLDDASNAQADMIANAAAAAKSKQAGRRGFGSRIWGGGGAADGTPEAELNVRILELESEAEDYEERLSMLKSEVVVVRTAYKAEEYKYKKRVEALEEINKTYAIKVAVMEDKLFKATGSVGENEGILGESANVGGSDQGEPVQLDAVYVAKLRSDVDKAEEKAAALKKESEDQAKAAIEEEERLREKIESLKQERSELENSLTNQKDLIKQERASELEDLHWRLEARERTINSMQGTMLELNEKVGLLQVKDEHIKKLKEDIARMKDDVAAPTSRVADLSLPEDKGRREEVSATVGDALASASAFG